ncbi:hypothetical protein DdX_14792 [Ditylenchus destructor]|uniref:Uncharacterized protein n=1 Tax=Ditylenchus destructor TaxID=166010 RepID=A0AAD4MTZ4_9BILA|nr:hypothetical protein DdX_14792 [Ditylenchus destructor]
MSQACVCRGRTFFPLRHSVLGDLSVCGQVWASYTFHIYDNVVGKSKSFNIVENSEITPESTVPELEQWLKVSNLWPSEAKYFYISISSTFLDLAEEDKQLKFYAPEGNETLFIGFDSDQRGKYIFRKENQYILEDCYTFHIYDNVVGKSKSFNIVENSEITPESTVPELEQWLKVSKLWPREAKAFYINGGLAKEDKQLKYYAPEGNETLYIAFVSDPAATYIFRNGDQFITPYKFLKKVPQAVDQSRTIKYTFMIKRDVLGRPSGQVNRMVAMNRSLNIEDLEGILKDSRLWPARAKAIYINGRCTSGFQTLASFIQNGNKRLVVDFVEDPSPIYTILVNTGKVYELFKDPDQKFQNKELLTKGDIRTPIGPTTTVPRLKMKIKKAKKWPQGKKGMIINNIRTCTQKPCESEQLRHYQLDGLLTIDFV